MPRRPRIKLAGMPQHIVQRGINREPCFFAEEDCHSYLHWLEKAAADWRCAVHAYGQDTIDENGSTGDSDTLKFGAGIKAADVAVKRVGSDLVFALSGGTDKVTVQNGYGNANNQLEKITFEDGTTWSGAEAAIMGATMVGTAANDVMNGSDAFADTMRGLSGDDSMNGYGGNDKIRVATKVRCTRKRPGRPAGKSGWPGDTKMQTDFGC